MLFKNHVIDNEEAPIYDKRHNINKILFSEVSTSSSLSSPIGRCFRKVIAFSDFKFEDKINLTSRSSFMRRLCRVVVYKALKSTVYIDLAIFLKLNPDPKFFDSEFFTAWIKEALVKKWVLTKMRKDLKRPTTNKKRPETTYNDLKRTTANKKQPETTYNE